MIVQTFTDPISPSPTPQQSAAIEVEGASVALRSGAGCGKTFVLTERYLRLLDPPDPVPPVAIVALTFTEKAAKELRHRIREACRVRTRSSPDPRYWRRVVRGLEAAPIGTFHSFCGSLLRRFPLEAGVEPGFAVLDETVAPSIRKEALARRIRAWLADQDADFAAVAVELGIAGARETLSSLIQTSGVDFRTLGARTTAETLDSWEAAWKAVVLPEMPARVAELAAPALRLFDEWTCSNAKMNERIAALRELVPMTGTDGLSARFEAIQAAARVQGGGTKSDWSSPEGYEAVKNALAKLRDGIGKLQPDLEVNPAESEVAAELSGRLARLAAGASEAVEAARRARGALDFEDLLVKARDLLRDGPPAVVEAIRGEVRAILVDEFQDTNGLQAEILDLLAGHDPDARAGRLFLVGDTNQSIYRFRGAQPQIFEDYRVNVPEPGRLDLTENRRSAPGIINFVNALFADAWPDPVPLLARSTGFAPPDGPAVTFLWAPGDPESGGPRGPSASERRRGEAVALARLLRERLDAGLPIWDRDAKQIRPATSGDVAILLRSLNDAAAYESALEAEGIDYYVVGGSAFFAQQEVMDLINLLSLLEDPTDGVALAASLRSPFFGLSDEGLYWLTDTGRGDLGAGLEARERCHDLAPLDRDRADRAAELLDRWRGRKDRVPIAELLDRALAESGYEAALFGERLGDRRRANARKLVRMARRFDAQGGLTLADFVARLRADLRKPPREEQAATTDEGGEAVRIMSIHQAKGLEFPIVAVPDLDRKAPESRGSVATDDHLGIVARFSEEADGDPGAEGDEAEGDSGIGGMNLGWRCFRAIEKREETREAIRLFYVAATRAREHLVLSAGVAPDGRPGSPAMKLLADRFDRATGEPLASIPEEATRPEVLVVVAPPSPPHEGRRRRRGGVTLGVAGVIERARRVKASALGRSGVETTSQPPPRPGPPPRGGRGPEVSPSKLTGSFSPGQLVPSDPLPPRGAGPGWGGDRSNLPAPRVPRRVDLDPLAVVNGPEADILRLARAVVAEPGTFALDRAGVLKVAERMARRLAPSPSTAIVSESARRLTAFLDSSPAEIFRASASIRSGTTWLAPWPPKAETPTIVSARLDLEAVDDQGGHRLLVLDAGSAPVDPTRLASDRLRLRLSALAASGPVVEGWTIRLAADGPDIVHEEQFDEASVDCAFRDWLSARVAGGSFGTIPGNS